MVDWTLVLPTVGMLWTHVADPTKSPISREGVLFPNLSYLWS